MTKRNVKVLNLSSNSKIWYLYKNVATFVEDRSITLSATSNIVQYLTKYVDYISVVCIRLIKNLTKKSRNTVSNLI